MTIDGILRDKGVEIITARATDSIEEISRLLHRRRIGAVLICDEDRRPQGILSERDVVRAVALHGAAALMLPAADLMSADIVYCSPDDTVADAMALMTDRRFRHLPVLEGQRLVGVVSIGDLVKRRIEETQAEAEQLKEYIATA
ncbi:CBS domain-containing protein [Zavarzinia sp. CC-PAN008]|uniref:CBS domain-containing protein n=1 Tax=Zavarzinia sp. CC-PAN008 TaxID=3243332 RepID=UPI003F7428CD